LRTVKQGEIVAKFALLFFLFGSTQSFAQPTIQELSVNLYHACAIANGSVQCWGDNDAGQLEVPSSLVHPRNLITLLRETCVLDDGGVKCWGKNSASVPTNLKNPTRIFADGGDIACAATDEGLRCWGDLRYATSAYIPPELKRPRMFSFWFHNHSCAMTDDGPACWGGQNHYGENNPPVGLQNATELAAGWDFACAIADGAVKCWGDNFYGNTDVPTMTNPRGLVSDGRGACAIADEGVLCWGIVHRDFEQVTAFESPSKVEIGHYSLVAVTSHGLQCLTGDMVVKIKDPVCQIPANLRW
jgi:hypothetical protein